jgi:hypothetical protein
MDMKRTAASQGQWNVNGSLSEVQIGGMRVRLDPRRAIGKGGEADVYDIGMGRALKIFKEPGHPDYQGLPLDQQAAEERLLVHQTKLPSFPSKLPDTVVKPLELAHNSLTGAIAGYSMTLLRNAEAMRRFSSKGTRPHGIDGNDIIEILRDLHGTVKGIHTEGVIIGDFNDLNVLAVEKHPHIIDADSFQFGQFFCTVFTTRFLDPLLCDPSSPFFTLSKPYNSHSDWFAFAVMVMQSLLCVGPYGGIFAPQDPSKRVSHELRPLHRITIFHPEVKYPKSALHYSLLPDDMLQYFHELFIMDRRGEFPFPLLGTLRWTRCIACGTEHACDHCPQCSSAALEKGRVSVIVQGNVVVTKVFRTEGIIVAASPDDGALHWLYNEGDRFFREDGREILKGTMTSSIKCAIAGKKTIIGHHEHLVIIEPGKEKEHMAADECQGLPSFDACGRALFHIKNGRLLRQDAAGPAYLGDVLEGQTWFKAGPGFGLGFYRAGGIVSSFVFDASRGGIRETKAIPWLRAALTEASCFFTREHCWFFIAVQEKGQTIHHCLVILSDGAIIAHEESLAGDGSWLGGPIGTGKCPFRHFLLAATDDGLVRVEPQGSTIVKTREFPDTARVVDESSRIYAGNGGLFVVNDHEVLLIKMG